MTELKGKSLSKIKESKGYFEFGGRVRDGVLVKTRYIIAYDKALKEYTPIKLYISKDGKIKRAYKVTCLLSKDKEALKEAILFFDEAITSQIFDTRHYGLLFYSCGYDGKLQSELSADFAKKGVYVF